MGPVEIFYEMIVNEQTLIRDHTENGLKTAGIHFQPHSSERDSLRNLEDGSSVDRFTFKKIKLTYVSLGKFRIGRKKNNRQIF